MTIAQTLTPLPPAPDSGAPDTFNDLADSWCAALPLFGTQLNTVIGQINAETAALNTLAGVALKYTFSSTTTDADPTPGFLRLDNATQNISTTVRLDLVDGNGVTVTTLIDTFDDSTSVIKGILKVQHASDMAKWLVFNITAVATPAGYRNVTVTPRASSAANPFTNGDTVIISFVPNGDTAVAQVTQAQLQDQTFTGFTTGGTLTAYTLTPTPAIAAYTAGKSFFVTFHTVSGAAPTVAISGVATPPNLVKLLADGTYTNIAAGDLPTNHRSRVTLLSATQAWVESVPLKALPNIVIDRAYGEYTANADLSTFIPLDDTIPQNTEGAQIISVTITPKSVNSRIRFRAQLVVIAASSAQHVGLAVFSTVGGVNAVKSAFSTTGAANFATQIVIEGEHVPGTTAAQTYTVRVGCAGAVIRLNGLASQRLYGGTLASTLVLEEIAQ